ncbi:TPA: LOG family protein [Pseudomonas aeruginosa]|uniref:AMP nucleosidase n=1 Tax=Pseudomonas aeruginosa TaxID=287 RepID=A0A6B1Y0E1_PSEAI|nr:LOG family protein [Pseudomonas aeruginosa]KEA10415.1 cytochrome D ubiquinol oxidase subunit II [Pseudomonas aeruginosa C2773C]HCL3094142.1 LOG family protein [Pseudomonas aeruginosa AF9A]AXR27592.1 LOG family protein [Pseudomonas aeruginosa]EIU5454669.1 LOG family protein [Pseudomonas aeruginosa]EIU5538991.1 LOG family protein [Pseudomonas aeruginosa]
MPYEADDYLSRHFQTSGTDLARKVDELAALAAPGDSPNLALYREMLFTVTRMAQADRNRWDAKIMLQTLREMEHAFSVLEQFKRRRKVTVFGSARTPVEHPVYALARKLGEELARYDLMVITGAGGGIMAAAHEGAGLENSLGFNITLPFEQHANHTVDGSGNLLSFHFFFLRKLFFVKEADALVLCPGGFGTLDEALEVLTLVQTGKSPLVPIVLLDQPGGRYWEHALEFMQEQLLENHYILPADMRLMRLVHSAEDAVKEIAQFYRNFHSSRWLKGTFVIRLNHALNEAALAHLDEHFASLCLSGGFQQQAYSEQEQDEPEFRNLTRLAFVFNGRDQGRLRELLDYINLPENWD